MTEIPASVPTHDSKPKPMLEDVLESFDGWDEIVISQFFGEKDWTDLTGSMLGRAAAFVLARREGILDGDAYKRAMGLPLRELKALFADDDLDAAAVDKSYAEAVASGDVEALTALPEAATRPEA